jgi:O-antigen/teichoic acid export membrane protein
MLGGNLMTIVLNILMVKYITNILAPDDFGQYSLIISFTVFPQLVLFAPIAAAIVPLNSKLQADGDYKSLQKNVLSLFSLIVFVLILFLSVAWAINIFHKSTFDMILAASFYSIPLAWLTMLDTFSLANSNIKEYLIFPVINLLIKLIAVICIVNREVSPFQMIFIFGGVHLILCFFEHWMLLKRRVLNWTPVFSIRSIFDLKSDGKRSIYNYGKNFVYWGVFGWAQVFLDKWIISEYLGKGTVGIYTVYYQYGFFPFVILSSIISQYVMTIYFSRSFELSNKISFVNRMLFMSVVGIVVGSVFLYFAALYFAPFFIELFTNESYLSEISVFPLLVIAGCFYALGQILAVPLMADDSVKSMRFPKIATVILSVALFFVLVPSYGLNGIIISLVVSNFFYFMSLLIINKLRLRKMRVIGSQT